IRETKKDPPSQPESGAPKIIGKTKKRVKVKIANGSGASHRSKVKNRTLTNQGSGTRNSRSSWPLALRLNDLLSAILVGQRQRGVSAFGAYYDVGGVDSSPQRKS